MHWKWEWWPWVCCKNHASLFLAQYSPFAFFAFPLSSQSLISSAHSKVSSVGSETLETLKGAFGMMIQRWKELHWREET